MSRSIFSFCIALSLLMLAGCQQFQVYVQYPEDIDRGPDSSLAANQETGTQIPQAALPLTPAPTAALTFDPYEYFFPDEVLPQGVNFVADDKKTFLVSYLTSPGNLLGIAHVREYDSYSNDIFVTQMLIQCPIKAQPDMLKSGHHGGDFYPTSAEFSLGEMSMLYHSEDNISYRFYKNNMIVVVDLRGSHAFVSEENVYLLAKTIFDKLPESFPVPTLIESPPLEQMKDLEGEYFRVLELVSCQPPNEALNPVVETDLGYCFHTDITELIRNLKVGIYDKRYGKLVYMKEFLFTPHMGEWVTGLFYPVWGFAWQHFHAGEYEALFWVDDRLVEVIPYTLVAEQNK